MPSLGEMSSDSDWTFDTAAHAVVPLSWCEHLETVAPLAATGIDAKTRCKECDSPAEVWICLTCWQGGCGRYVAGHASAHFSSTGHPIALSLADLSTWCYACDAYVHHEKVLDAKRAAHKSKFGDDMPIQRTGNDDGAGPSK